MKQAAFLTRILDPGLVMLAQLGGPAVSDTAAFAIDDPCRHLGHSLWRVTKTPHL